MWRCCGDFLAHFLGCGAAVREASVTGGCHKTRRALLKRSISSGREEEKKEKNTVLSLWHALSRLFVCFFFFIALDYATTGTHDRFQLLRESTGCSFSSSDTSCLIIIAVSLCAKWRFNVSLFSLCVSRSLFPCRRWRSGATAQERPTAHQRPGKLHRFSHETPRGAG